jgi:hypothetical protein
MDAARHIYTALSIYGRGLPERHDLVKAALGISQPLSPGVLARVFDCRGDSWPRFPSMPLRCDYDVHALPKELRSLASEAGFLGASHALLRRFNEDIVLAVVLPRHKSSSKLLLDFMTATNSGASQFRVETIGARLFRSLFPSPARARDVFISRILRDSLPIVHASARPSISTHATTA